MEKPVSVKRKELTEKLLNIANNEDLPAILMVDIFNQVAMAVAQMAEYQEKKEMAEWNSYLERAESDEQDRTVS
jgi:hypothetical protein